MKRGKIPLQGFIIQLSDPNVFIPILKQDGEITISITDTHLCLNGLTSWRHENKLWMSDLGLLQQVAQAVTGATARQYFQANAGIIP
jgi:hypothetical protein